MNILYQFHKKRLLFNSNLNKNICRHGHLFKFNLSNKLRYSSTSKKFTKKKKLEAKSIKESLPPKFDDGINNESDDLVLIQKKFGKKPVIFVYFNLYIITFFALYAFNNFSGVFDPRNIEFKVKDLTGYFSNSASDELINEGGKLENKDSEVVKWVQEKLHIEESNLNTLSTVFVAVVFTEYLQNYNFISFY
ncbi:hypothetical protein HDU92_001836 [Lobulomyces angularis]|nr:hypothetical protein HDU92_001836 [Lobulomyces angularis]